MAYRDIIKFLTPYMDEEHRRLYVRETFPGEPIVDNLSYAGSKRKFTVNLIDKLHLYDGRDAVIRLLRVMQQEHVGPGKQREIDDLISQLESNRDTTGNPGPVEASGSPQTTEEPALPIFVSPEPEPHEDIVSPESEPVPAEPEEPDPPVIVAPEPEPIRGEVETEGSVSQVIAPPVSRTGENADNTRRNRIFSGGFALLVVVIFGGLGFWLFANQDDPAVLVALDTWENSDQTNDDWTPIEREFEGVTMVLVPAGSFEMGSTEEEIDFGFEMCQQAADNDAECPRSWFEDEAQNGDNTQTFTEPFWIDRTEVTRAQYQQCVKAGVCEETPDSDFSTNDDQPINRVTWFQAQTYCEWREGRLPTEAEWEYAARGPDRMIFPWGDAFTGDEANHCDSNCGTQDWASSYNYVNEENDDGFAVTSPVDSFEKYSSWVGALNMSGNVWEWTSSLYEPYPYDAGDGRERDTGDSTDVRRVLRGGSFSIATDFLRSANRNGDDPDFDDSNSYGFRCARSY